MAQVPYQLVCWRWCSFRRMPPSRAGRRSSLFDPADLDWRWDPILREARQRHRPPFGGGQSLQERHGGASLSGARTSRRETERHLTTACSEAGVPNGIRTRPAEKFRALERGLQLQEALVVHEPHRVGLGIELDSFDARDAHAPEAGGKPQVAPRLVAGAVALRE